MGSVGFLLDFEFYMPVLGVSSGPVAFVAPLRFIWTSSEPEKSHVIRLMAKFSGQLDRLGPLDF